MKQNRMIRLLAAGAVSAIAVTTAFAQQSSTTTTTTTDGKTTASTSTTKTIDGTGTITTYKPGLDYVMVRTESTTAPVMYYYDKNTTIVDSEGKAVDWKMIRSDMPVKYTYVTDGDRMVVRKITLEKPVSYYEKTTTTTTTTQP